MLRVGAAAAAANDHGAAAIRDWAAGARSPASPRLGRVPDVRARQCIRAGRTGGESVPVTSSCRVPVPLSGRGDCPQVWLRHQVQGRPPGRAVTQ